MEELEFHEVADGFPLLDKERFFSLGEDILLNGVKRPIELFEGKILDGRNRYLACQIHGFEPNFINLPGNIDPYLYVLKRRATKKCKKSLTIGD